jgi:hypothetical protein
MFYVVNNHLKNLYVLTNKAVGPGKKSKLINVGPTSIPEARVHATQGGYSGRTIVAEYVVGGSVMYHGSYLKNNRNM